MTEWPEPILLGPGEGERVGHDPTTRFVQIKADRPELALTESRYRPGERGPGPHVHHEHSDAMYVLDGELLFELGAQGLEARVGTGGFILVPPDVIHSFRNSGAGDTGFLNIHAPGMGFGDYLRSAYEAPFDTDDPPPDGGRPASEVVLRPAGVGDTVKLGAAAGLFKAEGSDAIGSFSLTEQTLGPGFPGPVPHWHEALVDSFYVLEGALTLRLGDRTEQAEAGSYALIPPGAVHTFANPGESTVRALNLMAPGGFEQYLKEAAAGPAEPVRMAEIAAHYDFTAAT